VNNTFVRNDHGITGGDNTVVVNNIIVDSTNIALKRVDGDSIATHILHFNNGTDTVESNVDPATTQVADPQFASDYTLTATSPAIDAGTAFFTWQGEEVVNLSPSDFCGAAPDLGAFQACGVEVPALPTLPAWGMALLVGVLLTLSRSRLGGRTNA
jgi:hypothetical protein